MTTTNFAAPVKKQNKVSKNYLQMVTLVYQNYHHEKCVLDNILGNSETERSFVDLLYRINLKKKDGYYNVGCNCTNPSGYHTRCTLVLTFSAFMLV